MIHIFVFLMTFLMIHIFVASIFYTYFIAFDNEKHNTIGELASERIGKQAKE